MTMVKKYGLPTVLAIAFIAIGFLVLFMAWNGAASVDCAQCQIPYLLSGGATGLGMIGVGVGLLLFEAGRRMLRRLEMRLEALSEAVRESQAVGVNGHAKLQPIELPTPAKAQAHTEDTSTTGTLVVIGRTSFHRPDCRLVVGKEDMDAALLDEARARGLAACRVCEPTAAPPSARARARR